MPLSCNLGTLTSWYPLGHSRPVTVLLYLYYNYIQNYKLVGRQVKVLTKIHLDQCLTFLITSLYTVRLCNNPATVFPLSSPHGTLHYLVFQVREIGIAM